MSMSITELERTLAQLRLSGARDTLQTRLEQAQASQMTAQELLALLDRRQSRLIDRRSRSPRSTGHSTRRSRAPHASSYRR